MNDFNPCGWQPNGTITFNQWIETGATLQQMERSLPWWIGDWLNYGESYYGESYAQGLEATGMRLERLRNYKWVSNRVDYDIRIDPHLVSWTAHRYVAKFEPDEQRAWLELSRHEGLSSAELLRRIKESTQVDDSAESTSNEEESREEAGVSFRSEIDLMLDSIGIYGRSTESAIISRVRELVSRVAKYERIIEEGREVEAIW